MTAIAELPGPRGLPGLGNAHQIRPDRLHVMIEQWGRRYGPVFRFSMGPRDVVGFTDAGRDQRDPARAPGRLPPLARGRGRRQRDRHRRPVHRPRATTGAASAGSR